MRAKPRSRDEERPARVHRGPPMGGVDGPASTDAVFVQVGVGRSGGTYPTGLIIRLDRYIAAQSLDRRRPASSRASSSARPARPMHRCRFIRAVAAQGDRSRVALPEFAAALPRPSAALRSGQRAMGPFTDIGASGRALEQVSVTASDGMSKKLPSDRLR